MFPLRLWQHVSALLAVATLVHACTAAAAPSPGAPVAASAERREVLVLSVSVDGQELDEPVQVERHGGGVWLRADDLRRMGIAVPAGAASVALSSLAGVRFTINDAEQSIAIETPHAASHLSMRPHAAPVERATANGWGAIMNYDATASIGDGSRGLAGSLEGTVFTPAGFAFAGAVATVATGHRAGLRRTDIGYTIAAPDRLLSATAGDFINAASSVSRPVRMAGLRIGTDFALRPDLVTFPLPTVSASAAVPTAVDVIVNGDRQSLGDVRQGAFSVSDVPVQSGVNTISVAVRDALGRPAVQTVSTYTSRALLAPGLVAWSAEAGWLRTGYLTSIDRYRQFAGSGTVRFGASDRLTLEAHGEALRTTAVGGVGASLGLGWLGMVDVAASASTDADLPHGGQQIAIGFERIARPVMLSARYTRNSRYWSDIASRYGTPTRDHTLVLNIGFDLARYGTLSAGVIGLGSGMSRYDVQGRRLAVPTAFATASTLVNATYSTRIADRIGIVATVAVDTRRRNSGFLSLGALLLLGRRSSGYLGVTNQSGHTGTAASVSQNPIEQGQWGFRAAATTGPVDRFGAAVGYLGRSGYVEAVVDEAAGHASGEVSARGSIGIADHHLFTSDTMTNSFAVIDTGGQAHVAIYQDNRRIGETDARGYLVAPNLAAYEPAKFSIDPVAIDAAYSIERTDAVIRPARRAGVTVSFGLATEIRRVFTVVDDDGVPLAAGAHAFVGDQELPIGIGGVLFAPIGERATTARVAIPGRPDCVVALPNLAQGEKSSIDTLRCGRMTIAGSPSAAHPASSRSPTPEAS